MTYPRTYKGRNPFTRYLVPILVGPWDLIENTGLWINPRRLDMGCWEWNSLDRGVPGSHRPRKNLDLKAQLLHHLICADETAGRAFLQLSVILI